MKKLALLLAICFCSHQINAQWLTKIPTNVSSNATLHAVFFTSPTVGYMAGNTSTAGLLLKTTDGGDTWSNHSVASPYKFTSIYFTHPDTGYVAGVSASNVGVILKTTDAGTNWISLNVPVNTFSFYNIHFTTSMTGFVSGIHGTIYKTTDAGVTWNGVFGSSWGLGSVNGMSFVSGNTGYVFGDNGYGGIKKTINNGTTWTVQAHPTTTTLRASHFINANTGWTVGDSGTILKTIDGGTNWTSQSSGTLERLRDVYFMDAMNGSIVGENGIILRTKNGGSTWYTQVSNTSDRLNSVHFYDNNIGYTVGENRTVRKTNTGGDFASRLDDLAKENKIGLNIYPNPSKSLFTIKTNINMSSVEIKNLLGKIVYAHKVNNTKADIVLDNYPSSSYFLTVHTENGKVTRPISLAK